MASDHDETRKAAAYGRIANSEQLGRVIRLKRKEVGMRQEVAAGMTGVGTKFLSQLENGKETAELGKTLQVLQKMGLELYVFPRSAGVVNLSPRGSHVVVGA